MTEETKDEIEVVEISVISQDAVGKRNGLRLIGEKERTEVSELPGRIPISSLWGPFTSTFCEHWYGPFTSGQVDSLS